MTTKKKNEEELTKNNILNGAKGEVLDFEAFIYGLNGRCLFWAEPRVILETMPTTWQPFPSIMARSLPY